MLTSFIPTKIDQWQKNTYSKLQEFTKRPHLHRLVDPLVNRLAGVTVAFAEVILIDLKFISHPIESLALVVANLAGVAIHLVGRLFRVSKCEQYSLKDAGISMYGAFESAIRCAAALPISIPAAVILVAIRIFTPTYSWIEQENEFKAYHHFSLSNGAKVFLMYKPVDKSLVDAEKVRWARAVRNYYNLIAQEDEQSDRFTASYNFHLSNGPEVILFYDPSEKSQVDEERQKWAEEVFPKKENRQTHFTPGNSPVKPRLPRSSPNPTKTSGTL